MSDFLRSFVASIDASGEVDFTGSLYGAAGLIRGANASGSVELTNGGEIDINDLDAGTIHQLSIKSVSINGTSYAVGHGDNFVEESNDGEVEEVVLIQA